MANSRFNSIEVGSDLVRRRKVNPTVENRVRKLCSSSFVPLSIAVLPEVFPVVNNLDFFRNSGVYYKVSD